MEQERIRERGEDLRKEKQIGTLTALPIFTGEVDKRMRDTAKEFSDVLIDYNEVWIEAAKYLRLEPSFFCQQLYSEYLGPVLQDSTAQTPCKSMF